MAKCRGNPLCIWRPKRPTPSPSLRREGSGMPRQATSEASKGVHFLLELHVANECRVVVCIRQWGPCLVSDCRGHTLCLIAGGHALRPIAGGACLASDCWGACLASDCWGPFSNHPQSPACIWLTPIMVCKFRYKS